MAIARRWGSGSDGGPPRGLSVVYLGADVPVTSWVAAVDRTGARGVALGVVIDEDIAAANEVVRALRKTYPDLVIGIGGGLSASVDGSDVVRLPDRLVGAVEVMASALA